MVHEQLYNLEYLTFMSHSTKFCCPCRPTSTFYTKTLILISISRNVLVAFTRIFMAMHIELDLNILTEVLQALLHFMLLHFL